MKSEQKQKKTRQPYEKPRLRTIELAAEEVLAVGCKTVSVGNPDVGIPSPCGIANHCSEVGS